MHELDDCVAPSSGILPTFKFKIFGAQLAGTVGYIDCVSTERYETTMRVLDKTLNGPMVKLR